MQEKWNNWFIYLIVQIMIWQIFFRVEVVSNFIFNHFTLNYNRFIYLISSKFEFPIGEFFYLFLILFIVGLLIHILFKRNDLVLKLFKVSKFIFFIYLIYNLVWGISYYKSSFDFVKDENKIDKEQLKLIYCEELKIVEELRYKLNQDPNKPIKFDLENQDYLTDFNLNQSLLKNESWIENYTLIQNSKVKDANISMLMNYIGILGYYNPFTIESNVNIYNTDLKQPYTIAHELGHQMGFASENEANFIAYFIGIHSKYDEVKYATYFKSIYSILGNIIKYDPLFVKSQLEGMPQGIKTDRKAEIEYYRQFDGKASDTFSVMNNQFLKANNQEGTISYSKYVELLYYYKTKKANQ